jgi:hypothetical protein
MEMSSENTATPVGTVDRVCQLEQGVGTPARTSIELLAKRP